MHSCPLDDQSQGSWWQVPFSQDDRIDADDGLMRAIADMGRGGLWSAKNIAMTIPKNRLISGMATGEEG